MPSVNHHFGQFLPRNLDWLQLATACCILGEIRDELLIVLAPDSRSRPAILVCEELLDNLEGRQAFCGLRMSDNLRLLLTKRKI